MKLIVGLGNPGLEYQLTPHNAGFLAIDRLAAQCGVSCTNRRGRSMTAKATLAGQEVLLAKPETFMNMSGLAVAALVRELELGPDSEGALATDLLVLYDELAFPLGRVKIAAQGSANGHNGIKSILSSLGTGDWNRIRIGVGRTTPDGRDIKAGGADYLLSPMRRMQMEVLEEGLDKAVRAVEVILQHGVQAAMNEFNRRDDGQPDGPNSPAEK